MCEKHVGEERERERERETDRERERDVWQCCKHATFPAGIIMEGG